MRRRIWCLLWVLLAAGALAAAPGAWAATQPVDGGTLIYGAGADPDNLDPANTDSNTGEAFGHMMYNYLVKLPRQQNLWVNSGSGNLPSV